MDISSLNLRKTQTVPMLYPYVGQPPMTLSTCTKMAAMSIKRTRDYTSIDGEGLIEGHTIWESRGEPKWKRRRLSLSVEDVQGVKGEINGFYSPDAVLAMACTLRGRYEEELSDKIEEAEEIISRSKANVLTKGRQTFDYSSGTNLPAAAAFTIHMENLERSIGEAPRTGSLREMITMTARAMDTEEIITTKTKFVGRSTKYIDGSKVTKRVAKIGHNKMKNEDFLKGLMTINSMSKDRERQKKDRRAIFSPTMGIRPLVHVVEVVAGKMAEAIMESCIHIGGNEKKTSLQNMFSEAYSSDKFTIEISGDNSKWNETMHPEMMAIVFDVLTEGLLSEDLRDIANVCFGMFESKIVRLGAGVTLKKKSSGSKFRVRPNEIPGKIEKMNDKTRELLEVFELADPEDRVHSGGGMLMGMMNKLSTICGIAAGCMLSSAEIEKGVEVRLRQSSDDFMALVSAPNEELAIWGVEMMRARCRLMGINWSLPKTFGSKLGIGEFTSMFHDGNFVANSSADLPSFKASGINETADIRSGKSAIVQSNRNGQLTKAGAYTAWKCLLHSLRYTYKIFEDGQSETHRATVIREKMNDWKTERMISDGGRDPFSPTTLECEEMSLRYTGGQIDDEYLHNIVNTDNPFSTTEKDEVSLDRENKPRMNMLIEETPNLFSYNLARNRTILNTSNKILVKVERVKKSAAAAYKSVFLSSDIKPPTGGAVMKDAMKAKLVSRGMELFRKGYITEKELRESIRRVNEASNKEQKDVRDSKTEV